MPVAAIPDAARPPLCVADIAPADSGAAAASPRLRPTPLGGIGQPPRAAPAPRLPVEGADGTHFIDTADVRSVRADAHYTKVHDGTRERMCPWSISEAEAQLDPGLFLRVHRSHIVAMAHVTLVRKEGDGAIVELDGPSPHRVPVSRAKIAEVKARLGSPSGTPAASSRRDRCRIRSRTADAFRARLIRISCDISLRLVPPAIALYERLQSALPPTSASKGARTNGGDA